MFMLQGTPRSWCCRELLGNSKELLGVCEGVQVNLQGGDGGDEVSVIDTCLELMIISVVAVSNGTKLDYFTALVHNLYKV